MDCARKNPMHKPPEPNHIVPGGVASKRGWIGLDDATRNGPLRVAIKLKCEVGGAHCNSFAAGGEWRGRRWSMVGALRHSYGHQNQPGHPRQH